MFAVVKSGGKQHRVSVGQNIKLERMPAEVGDEITLDHVLLAGEGGSIQIGTPVLSGVLVKATVVAQGRHDKLRVFKMRRRKNYQKHQGHRQNYTQLRIDAIEGATATQKQAVDQTADPMAETPAPASGAMPAPAEAAAPVEKTDGKVADKPEATES